jgi:hypothetical protein
MSSVVGSLPDADSFPAPLYTEEDAADVPAYAAPLAALVVPADVQANNYIVPTCFTRKPPSGVTYARFQPMNIRATGHYLNKGFPEEIPISDLDPHAFVGHDVRREDWLRYIVLQGVSISLCLTFGVS